MTRGLPGSGKTTWAKGVVEGSNGEIVRVNKDDIRLELGKPWSQDVENEVIYIRDIRIMTALESGKSVISDDTNFARKHKVRLAQIAGQVGATFEIKDFKDVPVEVCIERDSKRPENQRVGEKVIWDMHKKYIQPQVVEVKRFVQTASGLQKAVICDLDGTLSLFDEKGHRGPYDASKADQDDINESVLGLLWAMINQDYEVIFVSGREEVYKPQTLLFLAKCGLESQPLFMRAKGDFRKDWIVKNELFLNNIANKWEIVFILDDRDQVVKMWRDMGLQCFQVNYGAF